MSDLKIEEIDGKVRFFAKVVPGSSKTALCGVLDGMLKVKVTAAPEKGKANKCLTEFLAKQLGIKKNDITVCSGQASPVKQIQICGVSKEAILKLISSQIES
jgi:uncharacterized protein